MKYFCPNCFAEVTGNTQECLQCGTDIASWISSHSYFERLIKALKHPVSEVRMGAIISLDNRGNPKSAGPLVDCAFEWPSDTVHNLEITEAIAKLHRNSNTEASLRRLQNHPARIIREHAHSLLENNRQT